MNFNDLNEQWAVQRTKFRDWTTNLARGVMLVRNLLDEKLSPPEKWDDPNGHDQHQYVEALVKENNEYRPLSIGNMEITANGEGRFYISVTFDHGVNNYPKQRNIISAVIRYANNTIQYDIWDHPNNAPSGAWSSSLEEFTDRIIAGYSESLSHDPLIGYQRPPMGFI